MLAGLIFATSDAADRPDALTATLPFGGASLIEYQARLLIAAGAAQILVAVARVTPELLGAANRIARRGVAVDVVRSAAEASAKVHPLARVVVLADGLVTGEAQLRPFVGEGDEAILITDRDNGLERLDANSHWAGIARLSAQRLADTASLPKDYDFQSALLRIAAQHGAAKTALALDRDGHGIEHDARGLARRGRAVFASLGDRRERWIDRWVFGPLARLTLPALVARGVSPMALLGGGGLVAAGGLVAIWQGWAAAGLVGTGVANAMLALAGMLAWLRGDDGEVALAGHGTSLVAALSVLLVGISDDLAYSGTSAVAPAIALIIAAALLERIAGVAKPRRWWPGPATYPLLLIPFAALGQVPAGLSAIGLYAAVALATAIEELRAKA